MNCLACLIGIARCFSVVSPVFCIGGDGLASRFGHSVKCLPDISIQQILSRTQGVSYRSKASCLLYRFTHHSHPYLRILRWTWAMFSSCSVKALMRRTHIVDVSLEIRISSKGFEAFVARERLFEVGIMLLLMFHAVGSSSEGKVTRRTLVSLFCAWFMPRG